jgi:secretion/DNA translocation related TadE-like protein
VRWRSSDRGAGSLLALGTVAALAVAVSGTLPLALLTPVKHRVKDAADAAALAAASVAVGLAPGAPCESAATVTDGNGARLVDCRVDGLVVTVTAGVAVLGIPFTATSTAGPSAERLRP